MCGIYGINKLRVTKQEFTRELNKMAHRGPDGWGVWQSVDGETYLGHRRLAIIDTDRRAGQPMCFDGRHVIVYNGEIYNYIELRKFLEKDGTVFHTNSDTEVLLQLILQKGPEGLHLLNGMWSFVIYDDLEKTFFFCRDRLGKKPLYYTQIREGLAFSSEMKNLLGYQTEVKYNKEFINFAVNNLFDNEISEETIFKGIKKFPAGSYGIYKNNKLEIIRYYNPKRLLHQTNTYRSFDEATEHFIELFRSSCKLRMRSDVQVGSALSGGIDSSYLVATLAHLGLCSKDTYKALVSSFPGSSLDETEAALSVARHAGVYAEAIAVNSQAGPDDILHSVYRFEEIAGTAPIPFFQLYHAFRKKNVFVTLDGHGSDELFGGYTFDLYEKLKDDFPNIFEMRNTLDAIDKMYGFQNRLSLKTAWPHFKGQVLTRMKERNQISIFNKKQYYKYKLFHSVFYGILPTLLRNYDKYSMSAGVEIRMPFLDYRIIEFAFMLPNKFRLRNGYTKAIVRNAADKIVPKHILLNKVKTGWNSPMHEWFAGPWKQWLLDEIRCTAFRNCDLIDQSDIISRADSFFSTTPSFNAGQGLWIHLQPYLIDKAFRKFN